MASPRFVEVSKKKPTNHGKARDAGADKKLKQFAAGNTPTRVIGLKMEYYITQ